MHFFAEGFSTTYAILAILTEISHHIFSYGTVPFIIFMVIDGCKIDSSQSISTGNQIGCSLASKKTHGFDIRSDLNGSFNVNMT